MNQFKKGKVKLPPLQTEDKANLSPNIKIHLPISQKVKLHSKKQIYISKLMKILKLPLPKKELYNNISSINTSPIKLKKKSKILDSLTLDTGLNLEIKDKKSKEKMKIKNKSSINLFTQKNKKMQLNRLYGIDKKFIASKKNAISQKNLCLENYQDGIVNVSKKNLCKDYLVKLCTELREIRNLAENVKPLPPINFPALVSHSIDEDRNISKLSFFSSKKKKKFEEMDEYEKEMFDIKKGNNFKKRKVVKNKKLYKLYEILPEYVVEILYNNKAE